MSSEWPTGAEVIRSKRSIMGNGAVLVDTNTGQLAVYALTRGADVAYQVWVRDPMSGSGYYNASGSEYRLTAPTAGAGATGVTLPAGKIIMIRSPGAMILDPAPGSWPSAGPLG